MAPCRESPSNTGGDWVIPPSAGFARVSVSPSSRACLTVEASAAIQISLETEWVPSGEPLVGEAWTRIVPRSGGGEKSLSKTNFILRF